MHNLQLIYSNEFSHENEGNPCVSKRRHGGLGQRSNGGSGYCVDAMANAPGDAEADGVMGNTEEQQRPVNLGRTLTFIQNELYQMNGKNDRLSNKVDELNETVQDVIAMLLWKDNVTHECRNYATSDRVHAHEEDTGTTAYSSGLVSGANESREVVLDEVTSQMNTKTRDAVVAVQNKETFHVINENDNRTIASNESDMKDGIVVKTPSEKKKNRKKKRKKRSNGDCHNQTLHEIQANSKRWFIPLPSKRNPFLSINNRVLVFGSLMLLLALLGQGYGSNRIEKIGITSTNTDINGNVKGINSMAKIRQLQSALPNLANSRKMVDIISTSSSCEGSDPLQCGCGSANQADYRGTLNRTKSGYVCKEWNLYDPLTDSYVSPGMWTRFHLTHVLCFQIAIPHKICSHYIFHSQRKRNLSCCRS